MSNPNPSSGSSIFNPDTDIPSLRGKVIIVTGANSGIGFTTAQELATKGAKVYIGARSEEKARDAIKKIESTISVLPASGSAHWLPLDLSTPRKAHEAAQTFLNAESRLDVLIHNAGMLPSDYSEINEGDVKISSSMVTNHLAPFVLTKALIPVLKRTAELPDSDVRIVILASNGHGHLLSKPHFRSVDGWNMTGNSMFKKILRYGMSKLANVLYARELQAQLTASSVPICVMAVHPGAVYTEGNVRNFGSFGYIGLWLLRRAAYSPREGAFTSLFAAASPKVKANPDKYKGAYLIPFGQVDAGSKWSNDPDIARDLWECSEELAKLCLGNI